MELLIKSLLVLGLIYGVLLVIRVVLALQARRLKARRARELRRQEELQHMRAECDFMNPIFEGLFQEAREAVKHGDWVAYGKARRKILVMSRRWQREVTDKLPVSRSHETYCP